MSSSQVRAGQAFVEIVAKEKLGAGLSRAMGKLKAFAAAVRATKAADMFKDMGRTLTGVGAAMAAAGGGIVAVMASSVSKFMEVSKHAKAIGVAIAGIDPTKFNQLNAAFNTAKAVLGAIQFFVGAALAEPLTKILHVLIGVGLEVAKFIKNNQQLVVTVAAVGAGLLVAGTALVGLGAIFGVIGASIAGVVAAVTALATPAGIVLGLFMGLAAVVLGGVAAWAMFTDAGQNAVGGIAAAIGNGDITGAFAIVMQSLGTMWAQFSELVVKMWTGAAQSIIAAWKVAVKEITTGLLEMSANGGVGGWITNKLGIPNVQDIQAEQDKLDKGLGLNKSNVVDDSADAVANSVNAMAAPLEEFVATMKQAATDSRKAAEDDLKGMSDAQKTRFAMKLKGAEGFATKIGTDVGLGSSVGQFGGAAAGQLGVGPQARVEQKIDETNRILNVIKDVMKGLKLGAEFT